MSSGCVEGDDCSDQESLMDEPMFALSELVCVTAVYVPLMLLGLLGNILTILVVCLRPHMRSSTYLYLSSMAVSDLLILLLLPLDLYKLWRPRPWPLGDLACKLTMFLSECCTFCTILHITFLSLERYVAVCWPITAKTLVSRRRTRAVIGCLWLGAAVSAAPVLVMVGVEDVGGEGLALAHWKEDGGWTGGEAEPGRLVIGGGEREGGRVALPDGGMEGIQWEGKETRGWSKRSGGKEESRLGIDGKDGGEDRAREEEGGKKPQGAQRNKKEDDEGGGGGGGSEDGGHLTAGVVDLRECRCSDYAVSSGLLSAMMVVSNLYFLIPLCVLGLVYSLIGRALCLRPRSSRRDRSHRHTVKMLGVIVLAFVLCWLPFHVGRTILSLSMGAGAEGQETDADFNVDVTPITTITTITPITTTSSSSSSTIAPSFSLLDTNFSETLDLLTSGDEELTDICTTTEHLNPSSTHNPLTETNTRPKTHNNSNTSTHKVLNESTTFMNSPTDKSDFTPTSTSTYMTHLDLFHNITDFNNNNNTHWLPDPHAYFLYYLSQYFNLVSSVLFYLSAAVNPLLYNLMSARYRHAVRSLVHAHTPAQRLRTLTTRHSTTNTTTITTTTTML